MSSSNSDLNSRQLLAVEHGNGPLLIFAGAGSGKTRVLSRRIAYLLENNFAQAHEILAVTFTNKAAKEMRSRIEGLISARSRDLWISTFHAMCIRILRAHADRIGYKHSFVVYDSADSKAAMKRVFKKQKIDSKNVDPKMVLRAIDKAKNDNLCPAALKQSGHAYGQFTALIASLYREYQEELLRSNAMDFGDLLFQTLRLFREHPSIAALYQNNFRYILVDEYQDTNHVQYLLVKSLSSVHKNICVVGDDDQSIYGFRGACVETILNFQTDFPDASVITLSTNYRSSRTILSAASAVIAHNKKRQEKGMRTDNPDGELISSHCAATEKEEARYIAEIIMERQRKASRSDEQIEESLAVFYRTNSQSRAIEEALCRLGIPYQIFGGHRFYDRKEIKDILAYLRLIHNPNDNTALLRVINTPARGIGKTSLQKLSLYAEENACSIFEGINRLISSKDTLLSKAVVSRVRAFMEMILRFQQHYDSLPKREEGNGTRRERQHLGTETTTGEQLPTLIHRIATESGYLGALENDDSAESQSRIENILELCNVALDFSQQSIEQGTLPSVEAFLDRTSLASDLDQERGESDVGIPREEVSLMTLHLAKGLEYDTVFLSGMEEGMLPHQRSIDDEDELEEERRLCYVGITRARKKLYLTRAASRSSFGSGNRLPGIASRFLADIPAECIDSAHDFSHSFSAEAGADNMDPYIEPQLVPDMAQEMETEVSSKAEESFPDEPYVVYDEPGHDPFAHYDQEYEFKD